MIIDPLHSDGFYNIMSGVVVPRPIAFVSTMSKDGTVNLAPYSFFNVASSNTPTVFISMGRQTDTKPKDTLANIEETGEFVVNVVIENIAAEMNNTGGPILGRGAVDPKGVGVAFAGLIVDVETDPETGKVDILRATAVQDAGKAIHPSYVEGQIQGGAAQGIGWALNEEYFMNDQGNMSNSSLLDYRMPTALDLPMIDTVIVEVANPGHPFGVRGVGEANIVPPTPTLANAIYDATGKRMTDLPMSPGAVLAAE